MVQKIKISSIKKVKDFFIGIYHWFWAFFSSLIYRSSSKDLILIGVTGTSGKSTTVELIYQILKEAGYRVAFFSSIWEVVNEERKKNLYQMTMPGRGILQKFLKKAKKAGCQYAIIEVTSEGILQHRHRFLNFNVAVFLNLHKEHIERHGSFENYKKAKGKLFKSIKEIHILNYDDENINYFLQFPANKKYLFGVEKKYTQEKNQQDNIEFVRAEKIEIKENGSSFLVGNTLFNIHLPGSFNIYNSLAAICVGLSQNISFEVCKLALEKTKKIPGRMEVVIEKPFKVIVDLAHTPHALEEVYKLISQDKTSRGRIIGVFGSAGGGRDKWKRPEMAKVVAKYVDFAIICNEDPYDENPDEILNNIEDGFKEVGFKNYKKIKDRKKAIRESLKIAQDGDIVVITGKGSEPWLSVNSKKTIYWDEPGIIKKIYAELKSTKGKI